MSQLEASQRWESLRPRLNALLAWAIILGVALLILRGRYDWEPATYSFSQRGYLSSSYLLVLLLPTSFYLLKSLLGRRWLAGMITGSIAGVFCLPYRWFGLDDLYYFGTHPTIYSAFDPAQPRPKFDWLPGALRNLHDLPNEGDFFLWSVLTGLAVAGAYMWHRKNKEGHFSRPLIWKTCLWLGLYGFLLFQTWMHLSLRAPANYVTAISYPKNYVKGYEEFWAIGYMFPQGQGAAQGDYWPVWQDLEMHFQGIAKVTNTMLIRRSFYAYVISQFSYFVNPYYVYLIFNIALWMTACFCGHRFARAIWDQKTAMYFTFLIGTGSGFIAYVAQPSNYMASYALVIILICLYEVLFGERAGGLPGGRDSFTAAVSGSSQEQRAKLNQGGMKGSKVNKPFARAGSGKKADQRGGGGPVKREKNADGRDQQALARYVLFGCVLGLAALVYDLFTFGAFFLGYAWLRRRSVWKVGISIAWAAAIYTGFIYLQSHVLKLQMDPGNTSVITRSLENIRILVTRPDLGKIYTLSADFVRMYFGNLGNAFFVASFLLAACGAFMLRDRVHAAVVGLLILPSVLGLAVLHYGSHYQATNPRLVYNAYAGIYLLGAIAICKIEAFVRAKREYLGNAVLGVALGGIFVLSNIDILGFPQTYYLFFFPGYVDLNKLIACWGW